MEELCLRAQEMRGGEAWSGGTLEGQRQERLKPPVAAGDVLSCPVAAGQRIISAPVEAGGDQLRNQPLWWQGALQQVHKMSLLGQTAVVLRRLSSV